MIFVGLPRLVLKSSNGPHLNPENVQRDFYFVNTPFSSILTMSFVFLNVKLIMYYETVVSYHTVNILIH